MSLVDIVQSRINTLFEEYASLTSTSEEEIAREQERISQLSSIIKQLEDDLSNFRNLSLDDLDGILLDDKESLKKFHDVQLVLQAIYTAHLPISLTNQQLDFIQQTLDEMKEQKTALAQSVENHSKQRLRVTAREETLAGLIENFESLEEKITNPEDLNVLNVSDFQLLYTIVEDESIESNVKIDLLRQIVEYNESILTKNRKPFVVVDFDDVKSLFQEFGVSDKVIHVLERNKTEVVHHINLDSARELLSYLKDANILDRFSPSALATISLYSNVGTVQKRYEQLSRLGTVPKSLYELPSVWINNLTREARRHKGAKFSSRNGRGAQLSDYAHRISYEEMVQNEGFLQSLGVSVSIKEDNNMSALQTPYYKLVSNYDALNFYGFFENRDMDSFPASVFTFSNIADYCDRLIELDLLHGRSNYIMNYPSSIRSIPEVSYGMLYKLRQEFADNMGLYFDSIMSSQQREVLKSELTRPGSVLFGKVVETPEDKEEFLEDNFVDLADSSHIARAREYDDAILNFSPLEYSPTILADERVKFLEQEYRDSDNPYVYHIGNLTVSRPKLLRNYSTLVQNGYDSEDAFLYSAVRGMYLTQDNYDMLERSILKTDSRGEIGDDVSKKI